MLKNIGTTFLDDLEEILEYKNLNVHITSYQSIGKRISQQDRYLVLQLYYGYVVVVCDGHGIDSSAADKVVLNIGNVLHDKYMEAYKEFHRDSSSISDKKIISQLFSVLHQLTCDLESGTTVSLVVIRFLERNEDNRQQMRATFATLGDSPLSLLDDEEYTHMPMHSADHYHKDRIRIEESNAGYFESGYLYASKLHPRYGGIAMTRSLGDKDFDDVLFRQPSMLSLDISSDAVIVLASDGVLISSEPNKIKKEMEGIIKKVVKGFSARDILNNIGDTDDNVTLITISFETVVPRDDHKQC